MHTAGKPEVVDNFCALIIDRKIDSVRHVHVSNGVADVVGGGREPDVRIRLTPKPDVVAPGNGIQALLICPRRANAWTKQA